MKKGQSIFNEGKSHLGISRGLPFACRLLLLLSFLTTYHFTTLPLVFGAFSAKSSGSSGAAFLKLGAGARPTAMGNAFTSISDDVNAIVANTAGLATLKKNEFVGMRAEIFQDLQYNFFAFAHPTKSWGTFAVGLNNLNITEIEQRTADTDKPDSTFSSNDTAYTLAYAYRLRSTGEDTGEAGLHLGLGLKYIRQTLAGDTANSVAADLGSLYHFAGLPLSLGLAIENLGTKPKFKEESDSLPLTIKVGTSYRLGEDWAISGVHTAEGEKNGLLLALDGNFPRDNDVSLRAGTEFTRRWSEDLLSSVRAGYQTGRSRQIQGTGTGVSAGAGITYKFFTFDFAWMPFGDLGNTFRYSVRLRF